MPVVSANVTVAKVCKACGPANVPGRLRCHESMVLFANDWVGVPDSQNNFGYRRL